MLEKLFCEHEYKYFNTRRDYDFWDILFSNKYDFVCKKCGKVITVREDILICELKYEEGNMRKKQSMNQDYNYDIKEILLKGNNLWGDTYKGKFVDCVLQRYKERGIDLLELPYQKQIEEREPFDYEN